MRKKMLIIAVLATLPTVATAQSFENLAEVEVLKGWRTSSGTHIAGLRVTLQPGWKTYWRSPGDGGIPPEFSFKGSNNVSAVSPHWPVPQVFHQNGLRSIGYDNSVVFPITIYSEDSNAPIQISGQMNIGVCEEICIPVSLEFDALLPITGERDTSITAALINQPLPQAEANVGNVICAIDPIADGLRVTATIDVANAGAEEIVVIETGDASIWVSEADVTRDGNQLQAIVDMVHSDGTSFALDRSQVRITVLGRERAIDIKGCQSA